jgi:hypothetical protein
MNVRLFERGTAKRPEGGATMNKLAFNNVSVIMKQGAQPSQLDSDRESCAQPALCTCSRQKHGKKRSQLAQ